MFKLVSALRESHRRQPRPNGQVLPVCQDPHVSCRPRRRIRLPPIHRRLALLPREAGRTAGGAFSCTGAPAAHPHLRALAGSPSLSAYIRSPALADGPAAQGAARTHRQTRRRAISRPAMAKSATRPIRQTSLHAVPRPSGLPSPTQKSPHPKVNLRRGPERRVPVLVFLTSRRPGGGRRWP